MDELLLKKVLFVLATFVGQENAISRKRLAMIVGVSDRQIRAAIEVLRREHPRGAQICSSSKASGYWMMEDFDEAKAIYRERRKQAIQMMVNARAALRSNERYFAEQAAFETAEFKQMELIA